MLLADPPLAVNRMTRARDSEQGAACGEAWRGLHPDLLLRDFFAAHEDFFNMGFVLRAKRGESSFPFPFGALAARSPRRFRTHPGGEVPSSGYAKSTLKPEDLFGYGRSPR